MNALHLTLCVALFAAGLAKPPIRGAAWLVPLDRWRAWLQPTRVSAIVFYAAIGAAVFFIL
jgi:hypothetical protein